MPIYDDDDDDDDDEWIGLLKKMRTPWPAWNLAMFHESLKRKAMIVANESGIIFGA